MNIILLKHTDFDSTTTAIICGKRFEHLVSVLRISLGDQIKIGLLSGNLGTGIVTHIDHNCIKLQTSFTKAPPEPLPVILVCALPRPKMFRRIVSMAVVSGVKEMHFFQSWRVEKSYWQSPLVQENSCQEVIEDGLMQAGDTIAPQIFFHRKFTTFVKDILTPLSAQYPTYLFHPTPNSASSHMKKSQSIIVIVGPEGGFTPYEVNMLNNNNTQILSLGSRILRVEQAVDAILGHILLSFI